MKKNTTFVVIISLLIQSMNCIASEKSEVTCYEQLQQWVDNYIAQLDGSIKEEVRRRNSDTRYDRLDKYAHKKSDDKVDVK